MGDNLKIRLHKIFRLADGRLYGGSGDYQDVLAVREWLTHGGDKPKVDHFAGLVVETTGHCARLEEALIPMPIHEGCHAIGSGRDFAIAAMAMGVHAIEAVRLAATFDVWTNDVVESLTLKEGDDVGRD